MATKYTKEILESIVARSISMRQVILELNLKYTGGNYSHIKSRIEKIWNRHIPFYWSRMELWEKTWL